MSEQGDFRAFVKPWRTTRSSIHSEGDDLIRWRVGVEEFDEERWRPWPHYSGNSAKTKPEALAMARQAVIDARQFVKDQQDFEEMTEYVE